MAEGHVILEFEKVTIPAIAHQSSGIRDVSFRLMAMEIALISVTPTSEYLPLADAAEGLAAPESGVVRFDGQSWTAMGARGESLARGRIRRVFDSDGWISNLDLMENLVLAEAHHTHRSEHELAAEADGWARFFGLEGVPDGRPDRMSGPILRKLEWVRAFMGSAALLIIDRAALGVPQEDMDRLVEGVCGAAARGMAILWTTSEDYIRAHNALSHARRYAVRGSELLLEERAEP